MKKVRTVCTRKNCVIVRKLRRTDISIRPSYDRQRKTLETLKTFRRLLCDKFGRNLDLYEVLMFPCLRRHELRDLNHVAPMCSAVELDFVQDCPR